MIRLHNICKSFGPHSLIEDFSLNLTRSQCLCISGPSGLGKTTLLEIVARIITPDNGTVALGSERLGCVFQDDILVPWLNAKDNIQLILHAPNDGATKTAQQWLDHFDLPHDRFPTQMSGGMRRRLSLARAFASKPEIMLLDEPFAFLDPEWQIIAAKAIEAFRATSGTVLMISHQTEFMNYINGQIRNIDSSPLSGKWHVS